MVKKVKPTELRPWSHIKYRGTSQTAPTDALAELIAELEAAEEAYEIFDFEMSQPDVIPDAVDVEAVDE